MFDGHYSLKKNCRWCAKPYRSAKRLYRDGFCSAACKQAHYRAYKNYVTAKSDIGSQAAPRGRTKK